MQNFRAWLSDRLEQLQLHLARPEAIGPLVVLGLLSGLIAGGVMVIFRLLIAHPKAGAIAASFNTPLAGVVIASILERTLR